MERLDQVGQAEVPVVVRLVIAQMVLGCLLVGPRGLGDLDENPVGILRVDEGFFPRRMLRGDPHEFNTLRTKVLERPKDVRRLEGDVMNAFAASIEETLNETVAGDRRDELDLSAVRETELRPAESL